VVSGKVLARRDQKENDRQARALDADAARKKVQILGLQELFYGPYFCADSKLAGMS